MIILTKIYKPSAPIKKKLKIKIMVLKLKFQNIQKAQVNNNEFGI